MSDEQIRQILIERKKQERKAERREEIMEVVTSFLGWGSLLVIGFALSVIG